MSGEDHFELANELMMAAELHEDPSKRLELLLQANTHAALSIAYATNPSLVSKWGLAHTRRATTDDDFAQAEQELAEQLAYEAEHEGSQ